MFEQLMSTKDKIAIIGLGYVGWPLAQAFGELYDVIGYDHNTLRVKELINGFDRTHHHDNTIPVRLKITDSVLEIADCQVYILTVPTPVDSAKRPNLQPLFTATRMVGSYLTPGNVVIYESTVYPGCTEEECVPILEAISKLKYNRDFYCGYSPERISPGDLVNTLKSIVKVTSGSTPEIALFVDKLYASIITGGTYLAPSIKVAEAAKAIENAQRDLNISFVNELALLFEHLDLDTADVLKAASTKWNFLNFKPGLVGGHCIGVDPYYLAYKAQLKGYIPQVLLSGRRINENMGEHIATNLIKLMARKNKYKAGARVLLLGITYKENCSDTRNTGVVNMYNELLKYELNVDVYDPWANIDEVWETYKIQLVEKFNGPYEAIVLAVAHNEFLLIDYNSIRTHSTVIYDLKSVLPRDIVDKRL